MAAYDPEQHIDRSRPGQRHADPVEKALRRAEPKREAPPDDGDARKPESDRPERS
jgi:hypothetical protein